MKILKVTLKILWPFLVLAMFFGPPFLAVLYSPFYLLIWFVPATISTMDIGAMNGG